MSKLSSFSFGSCWVFTEHSPMESQETRDLWNLLQLRRQGMDWGQEKS